MRIGVKLILGFLAIASLTAIFGYFSIVQSQISLEKSIGEGAASLAVELLDKINGNINDNVIQFKEYSNHDLLQEAIIGSNQGFDKISNVNEYISKKDNEWVSTPKDQPTKFMLDILNNQLSQELKKKLEFYKKEYGYVVFGEIFATNKYGVNIAQTDITSDYYQADEDWWQNAVKDGVTIRDVQFDESANVYSTDIGIKVTDKNGNFIGVIKVVLNIEGTIDAITKSKALIKYGKPEFILMNSKGQVIYATKYYQFLEELSSQEILNKIKSTGGSSGYFLFRAKDSTNEALYAYANSFGERDSRNLGWVLLVEYSGETRLLPIYTLRDNLLFLSIIVIVIAVLTGLFLSRSISKPIVTLQKAAKEIEKGNLNVNVDIKTGDEVEDLGTAFNDAAKMLAKTDEQRKDLDAAKTEFLSIVSHELKIPLTPMKVSMQMLLENYFGELNKKQKEAMDIALRNVTRLDSIVSDFLEISRMESARLKFNFVKTDLTKHIKSLISEMKSFFPEKKINIVSNIGKLPIIEVDPDRIMQVLRNLITNAIKFSNENSKVIVTAIKTESHILFSVKDFGVGIAEENNERIFEPFFQEEKTNIRKYGGTGLGLTICRGIVESQKGKIWFQSEQGKGSTFYFTIPLKPVLKTERIKLLFASRLSKPKTVFELLNNLANENNIKIDYSKFVQEIINRAFSLYGRLALEKANSVKGLHVNSQGIIYSMAENKAEIVDNLAKVYEKLIGGFERFISDKESREILLKSNVVRYDQEPKSQEDAEQ